jgi:hypothetical protein
VQRKRLSVSVQRSQSERHFQEGMTQRLTNIDVCKPHGQQCCSGWGCLQGRFGELSWKRGQRTAELAH